jgi:hypothetical protein
MAFLEVCIAHYLCQPSQPFTYIDKCLYIKPVVFRAVVENPKADAFPNIFLTFS